MNARRRIAFNARNVTIFTVAMLATQALCLLLLVMAGFIADAIR